MPEFTSHKPGTFCWIELGTSDAAAAKNFYTSLFGWSVNENDMGEMGKYYMFQKNGRDCAAMYQMGPDMQGIPPFWLSYVSVEDCDAAVEKAKSLGGRVVNGPFDVSDFGRMAVFGDPDNAAFAVWQPKSHFGVGIRDESNTLCWNELQARDVEGSKTFYKSLFGWSYKESPEYNEISAGGAPVGGIMKSQAPPEVPPHWMPYFAVDDCDAIVQKATSSGAATYVPPTDIPNVGRFAVVADPQGAVFAVIKLELQSH